MPSSKTFTPAIFLIALLAASCSTSSTVLEDGPIVMGTEHGYLCVPSVDGQTVTISTPVRNSGDTIITIDEVSLIEADGLTIEAAYMTPPIQVGNELNFIGNASQFPPAFDSEDYPYPWVDDAWDQRSPAVGTEVQPEERLVLSVGLHPSTVEAVTAKAIEVLYSDGSGTAYRAESTTEITVVVGRKSC